MTGAPETAFIEVRVFPWRLRTRVMKASTLRENVDPFSGMATDSLGGVVFGIVLWLVILSAAPLIVVVLAALLFSFELPLLIALALLIVVARLVGVIPWTVGVADRLTGVERHERTRSLVRAIRIVQGINGAGGVPVRWRWS